MSRFAPGVKSQYEAVGREEVSILTKSFNEGVTMFSNKDYSKMTLDELVSEEKKLNSQKIVIAVVIGVVVGLAIWSATHKGGFFLTFPLLVIALLIGSRYSKNLKSIQTEIGRRDTLH